MPIFPAQKPSPLHRFLGWMTFTDSLLFLIPQLLPDPQQSAFCLLRLSQQPPCSCPGTFRWFSYLHLLVPCRPLPHCFLTTFSSLCFHHMISSQLAIVVSGFSFPLSLLDSCPLEHQPSLSVVSWALTVALFLFQFMIFERAFIVQAGFWERTRLKNSK